MNMDTPTLKIVVDNPYEAYHLVTLQQGTVLRNIDISKALLTVKYPHNLLRKNIRVTNPNVTGNLLIMKMIATKSKNVFDIIVFPNMFNESAFDFDGYADNLKEALDDRKKYFLEVY